MKITFSYLVTSFFTAYLRAERGLSPNTVASYSDCMRLFISYLSKRFHARPEALDIQMIHSELILDFLQSIEEDRCNSPQTRNQRLAAIKTFFRFLAQNIPELMLMNERVQAIKLKRTDHQPPPSMTIKEVNALLDCIDSSSHIGARDKAMLQFLYNTGARVQEMADLTLNDLHFDAPSSVSLTGKGRKTRVVPLWPETVACIQHYLSFRKRKNIQSNHLFLNIQSEPITRFGIGRRIKVCAEKAAQQCPSLKNRTITPHLFRHTTALHLLDAGNDIVVVKDWLGHADIKTTAMYLHVSIERKRRALEKLSPPAGSHDAEHPTWVQSNIMHFLEECSNRPRYVA